MDLFLSLISFYVTFLFCLKLTELVLGNDISMFERDTEVFTTRGPVKMEDMKK